MISNADLATSILRALAGLGVHEFVVAAGARNAPLLPPLLDSTGVKVWNFFDERSAAFFALGRLMVDRAPVAVLTTSGTAVAELLPAVIEAFYQGLPLVLVTADRPRRFRGSGAPQAVDQVRIFGGYAEGTLDIDADTVTATAWPRQLPARPLHVNVCFEEALETPAAGFDFAQFPAPQQQPINEPADNAAASAVLDSWLEDRSGLVVLAGGMSPARAESVARFLAAVNAPVIADATSNLHGHAELNALLVPGGDAVLPAMGVRRVLRIGAVPAGRWWRDLENHPAIAVLNVCAPPFPGLARKENVETTGFSLLDYNCKHCLGARLARATPQLQPHLDDLMALFPESEPAWIRRLSGIIPAGARVFLGNSLPIREWNLFALRANPGTTFYANRGANGIDGIVSTFLGVSAGCEESWLVVGDLSALYDLGAPWVIRQLPKGRRRIVVINNSGGKIFARVDSLRALPHAAREVLENRHAVSFEPWARLWSMNYIRLQSPATSAPLPDGDLVIEIVPDEATTESFWQRRQSTR